MSATPHVSVDTFLLSSWRDDPCVSTLQLSLVPAEKKLPFTRKGASRKTWQARKMTWADVRLHISVLGISCDISWNLWQPWLVMVRVKCWSVVDIKNTELVSGWESIKNSPVVICPNNHWCSNVQWETMFKNILESSTNNDNRQIQDKYPANQNSVQKWFVSVWWGYRPTICTNNGRGRVAAIYQRSTTGGHQQTKMDQLNKKTGARHW